MKALVGILCGLAILSAPAFGQRANRRGGGSRGAGIHRFAARSSGYGSFGGYGAYPYLPTFYNDCWDCNYAPAYAPPNYSQPAPNVTVVYAAPLQPASPVVKDYNWQPAQTAPVERKPVYFIIALRDGLVAFAQAYWVEDDTMHYVGEDGKQRTLELSRIDRERSEQRNRERGIDFGLPPG